MAGYVAVTDIKHGEDDGTLVEVAAGERVPDLGEDVTAALLEAGAIEPAAEAAKAEKAAAAKAEAAK